MGGMFSPSTTQTSRSEIPEELKPYTQESAEFLRGRIGEQGPAWPGSFTAPMTPQEEYGLGGIEDAYSTTYGSEMHPLSVQGYSNMLAGGGVPYAAGQQLVGTLSGSYLPGANPYISQMETGLKQDYQDALADAQNKLALAGHGGASTAGAVMGSRALSDYTSNLGKLRFGAYEAERGRMADPRLTAQVLPMVEQGLTYPVSMAQALLQSGALPRTLAQGDLDSAYKEMQRLWNESYRAAGQANPLFQPSSSSTSYGPSPFMSLVSGALPFFLPK